MSRIIWDEIGQHIYETGVSNGVLYIRKDDGGYDNGLPWNGLTAVSESPSGAEVTNLYADNIKYLSLMSLEEFGATVEAYTYPDEFAACDGSLEIGKGVFVGQQTRKSFGMVYKTLIGNDIIGTDYGYKYHIIYGCLASPSEKSYGTVNDSPEAITFSWEVTTSPVPVPNMKPTSSLIIDSSKIDAAKLKLIEDALFGTDAKDAVPPSTENPLGEEAVEATLPTLLLPAEILEILAA